MKKRFLLLVIFASILAGQALAYDFKSGELYYNIINNTEPYMVEVTYQYYGSELNYSTLSNTIIPQKVTFDGIEYAVTSIGSYAFRSCWKLTTITIPNSITSIGTEAFDGCRSLASINIPNSVISIGYCAFNQCSTASQLNIPNSVKSIDGQAFSCCDGLTSVTIPNSVSEIGMFAFMNCASLKTVTICGSIENMNSRAFSDSPNIKNVFFTSIVPPIQYEEDPFQYVDTIYVCADNINAFKSIKAFKHKEILPFYKVTAKSADESLGKVMGDSLQPANKSVSIFATPKLGYHFTHWSDGNTDAARILSVSKDTAITAYFAIDTFDIVLNVNNVQFGSVSGTARYTYGSEATIKATPATNYHFIKWSDDVTDSLRTLVVDNNLELTAFFEGDERTTSFSAENGAVTSDVSVYHYGDTLTITATPDTGYHFVMWSDSIIDNPRSYIAIDDSTFTALFEKHTIVVDSAVAATCTESGKTEGSHCSVCNEVFVAQTAIPALGHEFVNYVYNNDATTTADGTETATCERGCGATDTRVKEGTKLATTAITGNAANAVNIHTHGNTIVVENATDEICVYDAMGRLVGRDVACNACTIRVNNSGVYIVKTGGTVKRVMVK